MKLVTALHLLLLGRITEAHLESADSQLCEYCTELLEVRIHLSLVVLSLVMDLEQLYGASVIKPSHHYFMHTVPFVRDYGSSTASGRSCSSE